MPPPVPPPLMMHLFENPDTAHEHGVPLNRLLNLMPKRVGGDDPNTEPTTWGILGTHVPCARRIMCFIALLFFVSGIQCGIFIIWWLQRHSNDLQNAFVPLFTFCTFLALLLAVLSLLSSFDKKWKGD